MVAVTRLVTFADVDDQHAGPGQLSVSLRHEAELADGRRVPLLHDRGWGESYAHGSRPDSWAEKSVADIERTARVVVGPDEPSEGFSRDDMDAGHWTHLAETLRNQGVVIDPRELRRLPHDVVLSQWLRARIACDPR
ncbi:hypothetical protein [Pseudonocardia acaciae]|uniref:hypothetical protein n=1 Tax=Pseudonocardia acaciae TaxID=551276 RepID=UPI0005645748|nr:hypothetical protein [Pseudonocardia acaciae]